MESDKKNYNQLFIDAFSALDVTASEVASKIGVANMKIYNIINGKFRPGYETVQQILAAYPRLNANWLLKGQLPILHSSNAQIVDSGLNFVSLRFLVTTDNFLDTMSQEYRILIPNGVDAQAYSDTVVINITDDSMLPRLPAETKLLARPVAVNDWEYTSGGLYAVLYRTNFVVRRIKGNDLPTQHMLMLHADNETYGYVHVKRDDIKSIWKVLEIVGGGI